MLTQHSHVLVYNYKHGECRGGQGQDEQKPEDLASLGGRPSLLEEGTLFLSPEQRVQGKGRARAKAMRLGETQYVQQTERSSLWPGGGGDHQSESSGAWGRQEHVTDSLEADFSKEFGY